MSPEKHSTQKIGFNKKKFHWKMLFLTFLFCFKWELSKIAKNVSFLTEIFFISILKNHSFFWNFFPLPLPPHSPFFARVQQNEWWPGWFFVFIFTFLFFSFFCSVTFQNISNAGKITERENESVALATLQNRYQHSLRVYTQRTPTEAVVLPVEETMSPNSVSYTNRNTLPPAISEATLRGLSA